MARKKQSETSEVAAVAAAPPAPAPAVAAAPAPAAAEASSGEHSEAGAQVRNRTEAKLLKELESIRHAITSTFSELDKKKVELKDHKSATRRPRSVKVAKKGPAEVAATA